MKSVLISIQPKWCELIANGKKTVEVRKTRPKLETPFKVYIYCTNNKDMLWILKESERESRRKIVSIFTAKDVGGTTKANGKVIGEFVCDDISINLVGYRFGVEGYWGLKDGTCLSMPELMNYGHWKSLYGWHISNLVIYNKPRELSEFVTEGDCTCENCRNCKWLERGNGYNVEDDCLLPYTNSFRKAIKPLFRPPQSWCYVESE